MASDYTSGSEEVLEDLEVQCLCGTPCRLTDPDLVVDGRSWHTCEGCRRLRNHVECLAERGYLVNGRYTCPSVLCNKSYLLSQKPPYWLYYLKKCDTAREDGFNPGYLAKCMRLVSPDSAARRRAEILELEHIAADPTLSENEMWRRFSSKVESMVQDLYPPRCTECMSRIGPILCCEGRWWCCKTSCLHCAGLKTEPEGDWMCSECLVSGAVPRPRRTNTGKSAGNSSSSSSSHGAGSNASHARKGGAVGRSAAGSRTASAAAAGNTAAPYDEDEEGDEEEDEEDGPLGAGAWGAGAAVLGGPSDTDGMVRGIELAEQRKLVGKVGEEAHHSQTPPLMTLLVPMPGMAASGTGQLSVFTLSASTGVPRSADDVHRTDSSMSQWHSTSMPPDAARQVDSTSTSTHEIQEGIRSGASSAPVTANPSDMSEFGVVGMRRARGAAATMSSVSMNSEEDGGGVHDAVHTSKRRRTGSESELLPPNPGSDSLLPNKRLTDRGSVAVHMLTSDGQPAAIADIGPVTMVPNLELRAPILARGGVGAPLVVLPNQMCDALMCLSHTARVRVELAAAQLVAQLRSLVELPVTSPSFTNDAKASPSPGVPTLVSPRHSSPPAAPSTLLSTSPAPHVDTVPSTSAPSESASGGATGGGDAGVPPVTVPAMWPNPTMLPMFAGGMPPMMYPTNYPPFMGPAQMMGVPPIPMVHFAATPYSGMAARAPSSMTTLPAVMNKLAQPIGSTLPREALTSVTTHMVDACPVQELTYDAVMRLRAQMSSLLRAQAAATLDVALPAAASSTRRTAAASSSTANVTAAASIPDTLAPGAALAQPPAPDAVPVEEGAESGTEDAPKSSRGGRGGRGRGSRRTAGASSTSSRGRTLRTTLAYRAAEMTADAVAAAAAAAAAVAGIVPADVALPEDTTMIMNTSPSGVHELVEPAVDVPMHEEEAAVQDSTTAPVRAVNEAEWTAGGDAAAATATAATAAAAAAAADEHALGLMEEELIVDDAPPPPPPPPFVPLHERLPDAVSHAMLRNSVLAAERPSPPPTPPSTSAPVLRLVHKRTTPAPAKL